MISEQNKTIIDECLNSAIKIETGMIYPNNEFEKYVRKIKDLKLSKHIPSAELHEYLKNKLIQNKCSDYSIQEFFRWTLL